MRPQSKKTRAEILTVILLILGALGATQIVPNWRLSHLFAPQPPTKELAQAQADAAKAAADAKAAQEALRAAKDAEIARTRDQAAYAQQMLAGVPLALAQEPPTDGVKLALSLAGRAGAGLAAAMGDLPPAKQTEIAGLVAEALSKVQAERDAAQRDLAAKDAELKATTAAKLALEKQIPALTTAATAAEAKATASAATVTEKTSQLVAFTSRLVEKERQNGSLAALVDSLETILLWVAFAIVFVHFILPSLARQFPQVWIFSALNKAMAFLHQHANP